MPVPATDLHIAVLCSFNERRIDLVNATTQLVGEISGEGKRGVRDVVDKIPEDGAIFGRQLIKIVVHDSPRVLWEEGELVPRFRRAT